MAFIITFGKLLDFEILFLDKISSFKIVYIVFGYL